MRNIKNKNAIWWVTATSTILFFGFIAFFGYMKMSFLINGVKIEASVLNEKNSVMAEVLGCAKNAIHLTLNGREIFIDRDGNFKENIALLPGYGVISLRAEDKFGNVAYKKFEVVKSDEMPGVAVNEVDGKLVVSD